MKHSILLYLFMAILLGQTTANAQTQEAQQLVLNYTKLLELEKILDNMYKGYKILSKGYNTIKNISEGHFNMHKTFLDGLFALSPTVRNYRRIPYIINYQKFLIKEYKRAYDRFRHDPNLTIREIRYLERVYSYLFKASLRDLDELITIITASQVRMNDAERLKSIDRIYFQIQDKIIFLKMFNGTTQMLVMQRAKENRTGNVARKLHAVNP